MRDAFIFLQKSIVYSLNDGDVNHIIADTNKFND